jgi:hypothetical protein
LPVEQCFVPLMNDLGALGGIAAGAHRRVIRL